VRVNKDAFLRIYPPETMRKDQWEPWAKVDKLTRVLPVSVICDVEDLLGESTGKS